MMAETGLPEVRYEWNSYVKVVFLLEKENSSVNRLAGKVGEKVGESLTQNQITILGKLQANPSLSAKRLAVQLGISQRKTEENLAKLKSKGLLKRIGPAKGGHWQVLP